MPVVFCAGRLSGFRFCSAGSGVYVHLIPMQCRLIRCSSAAIHADCSLYSFVSGLSSCLRYITASAWRAAYESLFLDCGCFLNLATMRATLRTAALLGLICAVYVLVPAQSIELDLNMSQAFAASLLTQAPSSAPPAACVSALPSSILQLYVAENCIYILADSRQCL